MSALWVGCGEYSAGGQDAEGINLSLSSASVSEVDILSYTVADSTITPLLANKRPDSAGLIGRNATWGALYAARFQLGLGIYLRYQMLDNNVQTINESATAIYHTLMAAEQGQLPASLPDDITGGAPLPAQDIASSAAFFMGDACLALSTLQQSTFAYQVFSQQQWDNMQSVVTDVMNWLQLQEGILLAADSEAPNRLLFNALAFHSCGVLLGNPLIYDRAQIFVTPALALVNADGSFSEGSGSDTSYQGVAVRLSLDLLAADYQGNGVESLRQATGSGLVWMADRVNAQGELDSTGNTRTCSGGESFLGNEKGIDIENYLLALIRGSIQFETIAYLEKADAIAQRILSGSYPDGYCFD
ncbi:MAG: hypothetical protein KTR20_00840 [Cellvibrionaceae bacterium]|nr:hypothetical protein [Cellvibrionaceae bacterium]